MAPTKKAIEDPQGSNAPREIIGVKPLSVETPSRQGIGAGRRGTMGVWIHYRKEGDLILVQSLHAEKIDAATTALDAEITGKIDFIPWGANIADVIK